MQNLAFFFLIYKQKPLENVYALEFLHDFCITEGCILY